MLVVVVTTFVSFEELWDSGFEGEETDSNFDAGDVGGFEEVVVVFTLPPRPEKTDFASTDLVGEVFTLPNLDWLIPLEGGLVLLGPVDVDVDTEAPENNFALSDVDEVK